MGPSIDTSPKNAKHFEEKTRIRIDKKYKRKISESIK